MPLTEKGQEIMANLKKEYGEAGEHIFYAMKNDGKITGVDSEDADVKRLRFYVTEQLSPNISKTPEGYLLAQNVPVARTGEYTYRANEVPIEAGPDGLVRILREEEEVFSPTTLASFQGKPFSINHPPEFVEPENWKEYTNGTMFNVRRGSDDQKDLMIADLLITTNEAIELVDSGMREISLGYDADYEQIRPGLGRQRNLIGNHCALVVKGRAGSRCAIKDKTCDSCGNCNCGKKKSKDEEGIMKVKGFLKKIFPKAKWVDGIKDEDLELSKEEEKELEEKAKDAEEETEEEKKAREKAEQEAKDAEGDDKIVALEAKVDKLIGIVEALVASDKEVHEAMDKWMKDADEEETPEQKAEREAKEKAEEEAKDAEKEEEYESEEEEKEETTDAAYRAEILVPGTRLPKLTVKKKKAMDAFRRDVLIKACKDETIKKTVDTVTKGADILSLPKQTVDMAFAVASEVVISKNNGKIQKPSMDKGSVFKVSNEIESINKKNKDFWKRS
jgi:hypothetical protein